MKRSIFIKTAMTGAIAAVTSTLLMVGHAQAKECSLIPADATNIEDFRLVEMFENGEFSKLEASLEKRHKKNLASEGGDLLTLRMMAGLGRIADQKGNLVRMWLDQSPQSFFAQYNAGLFYYDKASSARGDEPASRVTSRQMKEMQEHNKKAIEHLQKAMQLDPRSALPHIAMLGIACNQGPVDGKNAEQWLQAAIQADPKNLAARINAINYLSPRWCGSFDLLDQMVQQAGKSLSAESTYYLEYNVVLAKASHEEVITKKKVQAHEYYKQAKSMCENSSTAQKGIVRTYP